MGRLQCKIHGRQSFIEVCEHIWENIQNNIIPEMKELPVLHTKICNECFVNNKVYELDNLTFEDLLELPEQEQIRLEEKVYTKYKNLKRRLLCIECLNTVRLIHARKKGTELPFEPYENTLMHKDNEIIKKLKETLVSNYDFQNFKNPYIKMFKAFHISSGGISYPFSIQFYYIKSKEDQHKLLKLIEDFFKNVDQKQRKISFYEAENWITEVKGNSTCEYKGEEKLLLEKIVK